MGGSPAGEPHVELFVVAVIGHGGPARKKGGRQFRPVGCCKTSPSTTRRRPVTTAGSETAREAGSNERRGPRPSWPAGPAGSTCGRCGWCGCGASAAQTDPSSTSRTVSTQPTCLPSIASTASTSSTSSVPTGALGFPSKHGQVVHAAISSVATLRTTSRLPSSGARSSLPAQADLRAPLAMPARSYASWAR